MKKRGQCATLVGPGYAHNTERGMTLVEVLVALGILAAVAITFLVSMSTSSTAVIVTQEQVSGESLAKSQMESIKQQDYRVDQQYVELDQVQIPTGYDIQIVVSALNPRGDTTQNDDGLQLVTINITHGEKTVFTLEGYKRFRTQ